MLKVNFLESNISESKFILQFDHLKFGFLILILEIVLALCENNRNQLNKTNHSKYIEGIKRRHRRQIRR